MNTGKSVHKAKLQDDFLEVMTLPCVRVWQVIYVVQIFQDG